ncbi:hypothetical protein PT300_09255 [Enterobacteriaceae bacterium ESL0689]|nr:hypothetical protein [Enterobacteriaceae bacterium ESL0689]
MNEGRNTKITGKEIHHVTDKLTETYENGQETTISAAGKKEIIDGGINTLVQSGNWTQKIENGKIALYCKQAIDIFSDEAINFHAPKAEFHPEFHKFSMTALSESVTGNSLSINGASETATAVAGSRIGVSLSHTNVVFKHDTFVSSNKGMEVKQIKALIKSGGVSISSKLLTLFL